MTLVLVSILYLKLVANCNAKTYRLVWAGYIVAGQATLYHRYVIILLLLLLLYSTKIVTSVLWPLPYGSYANIAH